VYQLKNGFAVIVSQGQNRSIMSLLPNLAGFACQNDFGHYGEQRHSQDHKISTLCVLSLYVVKKGVKESAIQVPLSETYTNLSMTVCCSVPGSASVA